MAVVDVVGFDDLVEDSATRFEVEGEAVSVVRVGDKVYAIGDTCSHANVSLSEGDLDTDELVLECWKHGAGFELETGRPICLPATKNVPTYPVTVVDGRVRIEIK